MLNGSSTLADNLDPSLYSSSPSTANTSPITGSSPADNIVAVSKNATHIEINTEINTDSSNSRMQALAEPSRSQIPDGLNAETRGANLKPNNSGGTSTTTTTNTTTACAPSAQTTSTSTSTSTTNINDNKFLGGSSDNSTIGNDYHEESSSRESVVGQGQPNQRTHDDNTNNQNHHGHANSSHESTSSNSTSTSTTSSDASPDNGDSMLFTKRAISKNNSMTSVFSSFHSASSTSKLHKHKHNSHHHHHHHRRQDSGNNTETEHKEDASLDEQILGTSCDCVPDKSASMQPVQGGGVGGAGTGGSTALTGASNGHVTNKSRIQAPATSQMPIKEEIGTQYPFKEGSPDTITTETAATENSRGYTHDNTNSNTNASSKNGSSTLLTAAPPTNTIRGFSSRISPPRKYQPATVVLPSQKVRQQYLKTYDDTNMANLPRANSTQTLDKFPFIGLGPSDGAITSLPSSFSSRKGVAGLDDAATDPSDLTRRRTLSDDESAATDGLVSPPPRQIRELKTPMYVPAVLRRTAPTFSSDQFLPSALLESPRSARSSLSEIASPLQRSVSYQNLFVSRTPTKIHWKPDNSADSCRDCHRAFSFFERRHHCRKCGELFCAGDSSFVVLLDQQAEFDPRGTPSRACHSCFTAYQEYRKVQVAQESLKVALDSGEGSVLTEGANAIQTISSDQAPSQIKAQTSAPTHVQTNIQSNAQTPTKKGLVTESIAIGAATDGSAAAGAASVSRNEGVGSVPADWSWSTF